MCKDFPVCRENFDWLHTTICYTSVDSVASLGSQILSVIAIFKIEYDLLYIIVIELVHKKQSWAYNMLIR